MHQAHDNLQTDPAAVNFPYFGRLPPELRSVIWAMAFDDVGPAVAVCLSPETVPSNVSITAPAPGQTPTVSITLTIAHRHGSGSGDGPFLPSAALACSEAQHAWLRQTSYCIDPPGPADYIYPPRTIFLTHTSVITQCRLDELAPFITHIAVAVVGGSDILRIFEALVALPRLRTIIVIISSTLTDGQLGRWHETLGGELPDLLGRLAALVDGPSSDGEWDERSFVGWLLRNRLEGDETRQFYQRPDSPCIKLLVHDPTRRRRREEREGDGEGDGGVGVGVEQRWTLVFY